MSVLQGMGMTGEALHHKVLVLSLFLAAMERHHGDWPAAEQQMERWMRTALPQATEQLMLERMLATMGEGRVH